MLQRLPTELLLLIVQHLDRASSLHSLEQTCRLLHRFVQDQGWSEFVAVRFPLVALPPVHKHQAAHALTTFSRNLDRRAFIATCPEPAGSIWSLPGCKAKSAWQKPRGQTMGFQPMVDSVQYFTGASWSSQTQVAAWSAGAELVLHRLEGGSRARKLYHKARAAERAAQFDQHRRLSEWFTYRDPRSREGRDDITSVNLVKPVEHETVADKAPAAHRVVIGRAGGELSLLHISRDPGHQVVLQDFATGASAVRCADLMRGADPLLAVGLDTDRLGLFACREGGEWAPPLSTACSAAPAGQDASCRIRSVKFLSDTALAVGRGRSTEIVHVFGVRPEGLSAEPVRRFRHGRGLERKSAVYPIATFADADRTSSDVFLSGGYDSEIRMHDLRSPHDFVLEMSDPVDYTPIFSMLTLGREHVVTGGGPLNLIKFFDLRMPGQRPLQRVASGGWNLFAQGKQRESPVYSLSRPSAWSSSIFAGMENQVLHLNLTSAGDAHPDPVYRPQYSRGGHYNPVRTWNPDGRTVQDLSIYEQIVEGMGALQILNQEAIGAGSAGAGMAGYDGRWRLPVGKRARGSRRG